MISTEELSSTIKRYKLLIDNIESPIEKYTAFIINQNLEGLLKQLELVSETPQFKEEAEKWSKENGVEK